MGQGFAKAFNDHGLLLGLSDDDHVQYVRVDGTRALTGDMDMGGNDITNILTATIASNGAYVMPGPDADDLWNMYPGNAGDHWILSQWDDSASTAIDRIVVYGKGTVTDEGDIAFNDLDGTLLLYWDESLDAWKFQRDILMEGTSKIIGPSDPESGVMVGDRDYNDARYLELDGTGAMVGHLDPVTDNLYDLGDGTRSWRDLYAFNIKDEAGAQRIDLNLMRISGHLDPVSDNSTDLGDSSLSWRNLYIWNIYDEGGAQLIDTNLGRWVGHHLDPAVNNSLDLGDATLSWRDLYVHNLRDEGGTTRIDLNLMNFTGHLDPNGSNTYDLGDASLTWRDLYVYNIKDEDGTKRIDLQGNLGTLFYNEVGALTMDIGSNWMTFHNELKGTSAWTATGSTTHKAVVWDAANFRIYHFTSRRDMKENIVDMDPALSDGLHDLKMRTFDMREEFRTSDDPDDGSDIGLHGMIADEVWDVYGDAAAAPGEDGEPDGWSEMFMTVMLIADAQKAKKERDAMAARLDAAGL